MVRAEICPLCGGLARAEDLERAKTKRYYAGVIDTSYPSFRWIIAERIEAIPLDGTIYAYREFGEDWRIGTLSEAVSFTYNLPFRKEKK